MGRVDRAARPARRIDDIARQINDFLLELDQIGCVFKGFEPGLVDFYGKLDGKEMLWCWKQGEERIDFWHDLETGYAGTATHPRGSAEYVEVQGRQKLDAQTRSGKQVAVSRTTCSL